jgi:hypothetical protein
MRTLRFSLAFLFSLSFLALSQNPQSSVNAPASSQKKAPAKNEIPMEDSPLIGIQPSAQKEKTKPAEIPTWLTELVKKQFGSEFEVFSGDPQVLFTGDFDGDGVEDAVIVVRAQHPLAGMVDHNFKAFSPEDDYYGFGNVSVMTGVSFSKWQEQRLLVIIHGSGAQAWRAEVPKAKFLLVNVPFIQMSLTKFVWKKHAVTAINGASLSSTGVIFWDGKKYKFLPTGTAE